MNIDLTSMYCWAFDTAGVNTYIHFYNLTCMTLNTEHRIVCAFHGEAPQELYLSGDRWEIR